VADPIERLIFVWQSMYACGQSVPLDPLLTGSSDKIIRLWDTETALCKLEMEGHTDSIWSVHYDQGAVVTASSDRTVRSSCLSSLLFSSFATEILSHIFGHKNTFQCGILKVASVFRHSTDTRAQYFVCGPIAVT